MIIETEIPAGSDHSNANQQTPLPGKPEPPRRITSGGLRDRVPLSFAQQRLWFLDQLHPQIPLYNLPSAWRMTGALDLEALKGALSAIVARHEVLRTRFISAEGQPVQVISEALPVELPVKDLSNLRPEAREAEAQRLLNEEASRPFNLSQDLMIRCLLLRLSPTEHILLATVHHIATDAWSVGVFLSELTAAYKTISTGQELSLPELAVQYSDYAIWQREWLQGEVLERQLAYWKKQLEGAREFLELPTDRTRPASPTFQGGVVTRKIGSGVLQAVKQLSRRERVSPFMVLLAAFKAVLYRYTRQEDILVGSPIAGRTRLETEENIGFFVNTLVLRSDLSGNPTFRELLGRLRETVLGAFEHQDLPFEKLVAELHPERHNGQSPFIQVMFAFEHAAAGRLKFGELVLTPEPVTVQTAKFDLTLIVEERDNDLTAHFEYNTDLFDGTTIERLGGHWETLLAGVTASPESRLQDIPLLTDSERRQVLVEWNCTETEYPRERCIHELFEEQVRERPEAIAITFGSTQLSYKELNARANQVAWYLKAAGVRPGEIVAFCMERSIEMIVGLLGILKAGAAYASLEPGAPKDRVTYMLEDLQAKVLLTQKSLRESLPNGSTARQICVDAEWNTIARLGIEDPPNEIGSKSPAYVSFTSGSTGRPKGVCAHHRGVVRLVRNINYAQFSSEEVMLQLAPLSFDASTLELWGCLLNGGRLVIFPPRTPTLSELAEVVEQQKITTLWVTTGLFHQLVEEKPESLKGLRQLLTGGDVLSPTLIQKALRQLNSGRLIAAYGPTENTTFTTCYTVPPDFDGHHAVLIGKPISNTQCYVLDEQMQPVPVGVPGELYVGGDGLAVGYVNQPMLTAERFVANPFRQNDRIYKTGDQVRYLKDGNLEFLGRLDCQVKIRGFRVELGEIESVIGRHPSVRECAVAAPGDARRGKRLVAYVVAEPGKEAIAAELRQYLKAKLPAYMVPSVFVSLASLPLMPNGKVDRRALPPPENWKPDVDRELAKAADSIEADLAAIWQATLDTKSIGTDDNFFELGGHSLLAMQLLARVEKKFGRKLPVSVVFQAPTVRGMAEYLREDKRPPVGSSLVEIQPKGNKPPLYFVHGVGGGMFWGYTNLARNLGTDQPVYGLKSRAMDGEEEFSSIEAMATQYVADVRAVQPKGPYYLGGYCFGGNVAYEMARQLSDEGETVALLAIMNAAPPNSSYSKPRWTPDRLIKFFSNLGYLAARSLKWNWRQRRDFLRWKAALAGKKIMRLFKLPRGAADKVDVDDIVDLTTFSEDQQKLWAAHIRALIDYVPRPYAGKITLFRSRGHALISSYDPQYGWGELAAEVELQAVPGAHESILEEPHVRVLADKLKDCIARTSGGTDAAAEITRPMTSIDPRRDWNNTRTDYPREFCVQQLFEAQVSRTPDATAVIHAGEQSSYKEINRRANQIAHRLQALGIGPDVPVGICLERSINQIVTMLGVLKSGGAYVPLDPAYPRERLALMLEDSKAPVLLTQSGLAATIPVAGRHVICLDEAWPDEESDGNPQCRAGAKNLSYVIYTSGSTGRPKGVAMIHRPLVNLISWQLKNSSLGQGDRTLQFSSLSFDVSFQEIFSTLCSGGVLMLIDEQLRHDALALRRFLHEQKINRLFLPFIALNQLAETTCDDEPAPSSLREVITAGEQLRITGKISAFFGKLPGCVLHNHYGPTESHVVTSYSLHGPPVDWPSLPPIGRPIANTQIHLLDEKGNPVRDGEAGELYIGGECLARGYLHRPEVTAERFVPDPFNPESGARIYKTGDIARYLPDGNIEYVGRIDQQVKIRGYRVELGEIESVLGQEPAVRECAVTAREDVPGQKRLVGYVVLKAGEHTTTTELRRNLQEKLPDYMVPSVFVYLDILPTTPSGKVNRLVLPAPDRQRPELEGQFVAPTNDAEERLGAIWREVLNLERIGTRDNFFELGGNSLMVGQVISRIREAFEVELPAQAVFEAPTIVDLARGMSAGTWGQGQSAVPPIQRGKGVDHPPLSFAQRRLWFIDRLEPGSHAYNVPVAVRLQGRLDVAALQTALERIVSRHESLRTVISYADENLTQEILPKSEVKLTRVDLRSWPAAEKATRAREVIDEEAERPFDLARGPLLRCMLVRLEEQEHIFVAVMHHIISDGWSLAVFFNELKQLYHAHMAGNREPALDALSVQYGDYACWQREWMQGVVLDQQLSYWKEKLKNAPPQIALPVDNKVEAGPAAISSQCSVMLTGELTEAIGTFARSEGATPFMIMMTGLAITLHHWARQSDLVIGTVVAGRNRREIENLIGCFMNFLPVRAKVGEARTGQELLRQVKTSILEAQARQECPFEKIVEALNPERRLTENPLYNVALLMQNFPGASLDGHGIKSTPIPVDLHAALLDLRFMAEDTSKGLSLICEYKVDLFKAETIQQLLDSYCAILGALAKQPQQEISHYQLTAALAERAKAAKDGEGLRTIAVSGTFTAEPVEESLKFWMKELEIPARIEFAPYNQVFQQLLDPASVLSANQSGFNVLMVRFEDWEQFDPNELEGNGGCERVRRSVEEFVQALKAASVRSLVPHIVCLCPPSEKVAHDPERSTFYLEMEKRLASELGRNDAVVLITPAELQRQYPVMEQHDPKSDELGSIPYTPIFYASLGTMIARKFHALKRRPFKVIVLDCDETLWSGLVGEDGPGGIQLDAPRRALQEFMQEQCSAGMLLCLCSKNNEEDVFSVFEHHREMPLRRDHITSWRINWQPKSENLKSLAQELRLGLDSFIFIDDNPVECAEVEAACPEVLTLQLPESPEQIPHCLDHFWAFDHLRVSAEDQQRTTFYKQDRERERLRSESMSLGDFLAGLDLKVEIAALTEERLTRAAQLTQRTNQFNLTTVRRADGDFQEMMRVGRPEVLVVSVSDRFGAYGLVGLMIYDIKADAVDVDTMLLSCRVLGRGVEYQMVAWLGRVALGRGLSRVNLHFTRSEKNDPAFIFLERIGARFRQSANGGYVYCLPAKYAATISFKPAGEEPAVHSSKTSGVAAGLAKEKVRNERRKFRRYHWIAQEAGDPDSIYRLLGGKARVWINDRRSYEPAKDEMEKLLCKIWEELLRIDRVGIHDNFFELGGHSLLAVRLFAEVERATGRKLPLVTLFQHSTVKELAEALRHAPAVSRSSLVAIRSEGSRPPLFLVHGAGGDVLWGYANLAPHLGTEQPVYGIKSRALHGGEEFLSLEDMAAYYIEQLRRVQKTGPYHLGGYCFGGNVAYEMARQLQEAGEGVALVALLDSAPSNAGYERMPWWQPTYGFRFAINFYYWLGDFFKSNPEERWAFVFRKARAWRRKLGRKLRRNSETDQVDLEEIIDLSKFPENELRLWQIHLDLLNRHVSKPYSGDVTLFRTRGQPLFCSLEEDFGWGRLVRSVEIKMVSGSHESVFMEPEVSSMAAELKTCLGNTSQKVPCKI